MFQIAELSMYISATFVKLFTCNIYRVIVIYEITDFLKYGFISGRFRQLKLTFQFSPYETILFYAYGISYDGTIAHKDLIMFLQ